MTLADITSRGRAPLRRDRVPGDGPTDAAGRPANAADTFVRFEFPFDADAASKPSNAGKCFSGHFDASCPWRLDDPRLAADAFDPDVGFARVHYVMSETSAGVARAAAGAGHATSTTGLFKAPSFSAERKKRHSEQSGASSAPQSEPELLDALTMPDKVVQPIVEYPFDPKTALERHLVLGRSEKSPTHGDEKGRLRSDAAFAEARTKACLLDDVIDLEAFARYVHELKPRCQHDLAPTLYLTQAVLGHLLHREMSFFSAEVRELKNSLLRTKAVLEEAVRESRNTKAALTIDRWREAARRVALDVKDAKMENHEAYLLRLSDDRQAQIEDLEDQLAKANVKLEAMNEIREEARKARLDLQKVERSVAATEKKHEERQKTLKSVAGQKDRQILELRQKLESLAQSSDESHKLAELVDENAELRRRLSEGAGLAVPDGAYEAYAESVRFSSSDVHTSVAEKRARSARLKALTPPEAARVVQAIPEWSDVGDVLRGTTVDFVSEVLTCGVLDYADVGAILSNLSDMDGIVLFAMLRKTSHEHVVGPMRTVAPAVAAGWIVNAAEQAKKRLALGDALGTDAVAEMARALGDDEAVLVLDAQNYDVLAKVFEQMYYADELGDAAELLRKCTGATRTGVLLLMDEEIREEFAAELDDGEERGAQKRQDTLGGDDNARIGSFEASVSASNAAETDASRDASEEPNGTSSNTKTTTDADVTEAAEAEKETRSTRSEGAETTGPEEEDASSSPRALELDDAAFPAGRVAARTFVKPSLERDIPDHERVVAHMTVPPSWLLYCGCVDDVDPCGDGSARRDGHVTLRPEKLLGLWRREAFQTIRPFKLRAMVARVYRDKMRDDARLARAGKHRSPLTEYVVRWFDASYGSRATARRKLAKFIFSLQKTYEENEDRRVCQFTRLCGLYHPMTAASADLLLEAMEMTAACMSGADAPFFAPAEFWTTWTSGKVIPVDAATQLDILQKVFPDGTIRERLDGTSENPENENENEKYENPRRVRSPLALRAALGEESESRPEVLPEWARLPPGAVSVSRFMEFILDAVVTMHTEWHDAVQREFIDAAGEDQVLDFAEFKRACAAMKPAAAPSEDSFAFMYWRALKSAAAGTSQPFALSFREVLDAARRGEEALVNLAQSNETREPEGERGGEGEGGASLVGDASRVTTSLGCGARHGAASFLWHCGIVNQLGVRADGSSELTEAREEARRRDAALSKGSRSFVIDRSRGE
jgi:hypothetical protein